MEWAPITKRTLDRLTHYGLDSSTVAASLQFTLEGQGSWTLSGRVVATEEVAAGQCPDQHGVEVGTQR